MDDDKKSYIYIYIYIYMIFCHHPFLLDITPKRSFRLHPVTRHLMFLSLCLQANAGVFRGRNPKANVVIEFILTSHSVPHLS